MIGDNQSPDIGKITQFKPGQSGNPKGKPKGAVHLSQRIRHFLDNVDFDKVPLKNKEEFKKKYGKDGWLAIIAVASGQAMTGDPKAREWLRKAGFGDSLDITSDGNELKQATVINMGNLDAEDKPETE